HFPTPQHIFLSYETHILFSAISLFKNSSTVNFIIIGGPTTIADTLSLFSVLSLGIYFVTNPILPVYFSSALSTVTSISIFLLNLFISALDKTSSVHLNHYIN